MEVPKEEDIYGIWEGKFHEMELYLRSMLMEHAY
jgi:hypothetical protein